MLDESEIAFLYDRGFGRRAFEMRVTGANFDIVASGNVWGESETAPAPFNMTTDWANFGDLIVEINGGAIALEAGVLMAEIRENGPSGNSNALRTAAVYSDPVGASLTTDPGIRDLDPLAIAIHDMDGNANEANARVSAAFFPFSEGWVGGHVNPSGGLIFGNGVTTGNVTRLATGRYRVTIPGVSDSRASGILFAVDGANGSDNVLATNPVNDHWIVMSYDTDQNFGTGQDQSWSFVYVPLTTLDWVSSPATRLTASYGT